MNHKCLDCNHTWKIEGLFLCPQCASPNFSGTAAPKIETIYIPELVDYLKKIKKYIPEEV